MNPGEIWADHVGVKFAICEHQPMKWDSRLRAFDFSLCEVVEIPACNLSHRVDELRTRPAEPESELLCAGSKEGEIRYLEARLAKLKRRVEPFRPTEGGRYFFIDSCGEVFEGHFSYVTDGDRLEHHNCFASRADADRAAWMTKSHNEILRWMFCLNCRDVSTLGDPAYHLQKTGSGLEAMPYNFPVSPYYFYSQDDAEYVLENLSDRAKAYLKGEL